MRLLIALGGNALKQAHEKGTPQEQFGNCNRAAELLAHFIAELNPEDRVVITHGNGPQVGHLLVQQELAAARVPAWPLDYLVAMTQGQIGYMLQQALQNKLRELGLEIPVCVLLTRVLVDENDAEFQGENASKPIGDFMDKRRAHRLKLQNPNYIIKEVKPEGKYRWRRVVPSPDPLTVLEAQTISKLMDLGVIPIVCGGGGIPVILTQQGEYRGVEAVIDKDLAAERLAELLNVDIFMILTDVSRVKLNFGRPDEKEVKKLTLSEAKRYLEEGHFLPGSMKPKVLACIRFLERGGKKAIIASLYEMAQAFKGDAGTEFTRD